MRQAKFSVFLLLAVLSLYTLRPVEVRAQSDAEATTSALAKVFPRDRIVGPVEDNQMVSLRGNTLPAALPAYETGAVEGGQRFDHMVLVLKPDPAQQAALDALTQAQQDSRSPLYHQWITPEIYAEHFGVSPGDLEQVQNWLQRNGFQIDEIAAGRQSLTFSGTAAQVERTFQTTMRNYRIGGQKHLANAGDPMIPAALASVVDGVAALHNVFSTPQHHAIKVKPEYTSGSAHYLSPGDFATIYDVSSLYNQAYDGAGQSIAIVGRSDISMSDVRSFRSTFGLPAKDPVVIVNGSDPGSAVADDVDEAMLDTEWSGAVARAATVDYVTSASTQVSDGVFLSAQYIVNHNTAPIMSVSYGLCEAYLGASANSFFNSLWQQAAVEGITVLVSSGDSGAAGCDASSASKGNQGRAVNGLCSTPYSTCVGGTQFNDAANPSLYWSTTTGSNGVSALGYIPENAWNESGSQGLWSTGGGVSIVYPKPSWQAGPGVPPDGKRDVPDVALTAAGHDSYLVGVWGALYGISGTSAASPSFAGIMALVEQKAAARLGNVNPGLYSLATAQRSSGGAAVFHDVTSGSNTVPGVAGFNAVAGYDQATGLGSVDAEKLVSAWGASAPAPTPALALTLSGAVATLAKGGSVTLTVKTSGSNGFSSPVALSISGLPSGLTAIFTPATIGSPGSGNSKLKLTASSTMTAGTATLTVTATGGGLVKTATIAESMPGLTVIATPTSPSLKRGGTLQINIHTAVSGGFAAPATFAVSGLPSGVTGTFSPASIASPGSGSSVLMLTASKSAALGMPKIQVTASGGGLSASIPVSISVVASSGTSRIRRR